MGWATPSSFRLENATAGVAVGVLPISLLKAASVVTFLGRGGLLPIADLEPEFMDVTLVLVVAPHWSQAAAGCDGARSGRA